MKSWFRKTEDPARISQDPDRILNVLSLYREEELPEPLSAELRTGITEYFYRLKVAGHVVLLVGRHPVGGSWIEDTELIEEVRNELDAALLAAETSGEMLRRTEKREKIEKIRSALNGCGFAADEEEKAND